MTINLLTTSFLLLHLIQVEWITDGHIPTITNFQRTIDNNMISANCGGGCARCDPNGELFIAYNQNDGKLCT
jgi:hypothetical protein